MLPTVELLAVVTSLVTTLIATPASQPVPHADQTFISLTVVSLTPGPQTSDRDVQRVVSSLTQRDDLRALYELGDVERSQPAAIVTWPQQVTLASRYVPVVQEIVIGSLTVLEADCTINGEWLTVDPKRGYVKIDVDYRYVTIASGNPEKVTSRSTQGHFIRDCLVTKDQTTWMLTKSPESKRYLLFGIFCARIHNQDVANRQEGRNGLPLPRYTQRSNAHR